VLLAALRFATGVQQAIDVPPNVAWPRLLQLATQHKLMPLLAAALPISRLPDDVASALTLAARRQRTRTLVMGAVCVSVVNMLADAGIPTLALKGVALAHDVYPSPTWRYFDDIDLLVGGDSAEKAHAILLAANFRPHPRQPHPDWHHLPPLVHSHSGTLVELHHALTRHAGGAWSLSAVEERARPFAIGDQAVATLSDVDALILTALHARHNLFAKLSYVLDGVLLAQRIAAWPTVQRRAQEAEATVALGHLLFLGRRLGLYQGEGTVGGGWFGRKNAARVQQWHTLSPPSAATQRGIRPRLAELTMMDSTGAALRLAYQSVWPGQAFLNATAQTPIERLRRRLQTTFGRS
jgi:hypothetical protein